MKFLGVLLDSNLNWKPYITELSRKLARTVGVFSLRFVILYLLIHLNYCIIHYLSFCVS